MLYRSDMKYTFDFSDVNLKAGDYLVTLNSASHEPPRHPWNIPLHDHNSYEIHFISSGTGSFNVSGSEHEVSAGDVVITGPGVLHAQTSGLDDPMEEYCVNVSITPIKRGKHKNEDISGLLGAIVSQPFRICGKTDAETEFAILLSEATVLAPGWRERIKSMTMSLLIRVGRLTADVTERYVPDSYRSGDEYHTSREINRRRQIDMHLRGFLSDISEAELAGMLFVSRRQLSRIMRECYSMTFTEKVNDLRAEYAKNLLVTTDMTVARISDACGFSSVQYFYKVFARKYGTSPGKLRGKKLIPQPGER